MQDLGELIAGGQVRPYAVNADGSAIVGYATLPNGYLGAFLWTPSRGIVGLHDYMVSLGVSPWPSGLDTATGVSADGTTIVGQDYTLSWIITGLPLPDPCYANCDLSTAPPTLNVADFTCFLQKYAAGNAYANCDHSTNPPVLNVADFTCFLQKYAAGCP
jgi:probable HAF family extracellular repeat protein